MPHAHTKDYIPVYHSKYPKHHVIQPTGFLMSSLHIMHKYNNSLWAAFY